MPLTPAWRGPDGALFLCPRPDLPRRAADEVGVELSAEARIEGTSLWPIVSWPGGRTAFRLHPDLVSDVRAAQPRSSWPRESFELRKPPLSPPPSGANSATTRGVELLLASQQRGHIEALAAAYFYNPAIHSRVREAVGRGRGGSALDVSALSVASRAADPSLWEVVAGRARGGDRPSMHALCGWRDARGHGFFEAALPPAVPGTTRLFVLDALSYFIGQGEGQGLDFLKGVLGDPIADAPGRPGSADARLLCGFTLNFLVDQGESFLGRSYRAAVDEFCLDVGLFAVFFSLGNVSGPCEDSARGEGGVPVDLGDAGVAPSEGGIGLDADE